MLGPEDTERLRRRFARLARLAGDKCNEAESERAAEKAKAMLREYGDAVLALPSEGPQRVRPFRKPRRESEKERVKREAREAEKRAEHEFFSARSAARWKVRKMEWSARTPEERAAAASARKALEKAQRAELKEWNTAHERK